MAYTVNMHAEATAWLKDRGGQKAVDAAAATLGPAAHSALGASSAERWLNCPGSARLNASLPPQPDSVYSREGTRAHALVQVCLEKRARVAAKYVSKPVPGLHDDLTPVSEDMAKAVQVYLDTVYALLDANPDAELFVEQKFKLPFLGPDIDGSIPGGTNDCSIYYPKTRFLDVLDYKHGAGKYVEVRGKPQLPYYGLGAQYLLRKERGIQISGVRLTIVQPRCDFADEKVRSVTLTLAELFDWRETFLAGAHECRKPDAPCKAGPWCRGTWCGGALHMACDTFKEAALKGLVEAPKPRGGANGALIPAVEVAPPKPVKLPDPSQMDLEELGARLDQVPLLSAYIKSLTEYAKAQASNGRLPKGYHWARGRGSRVWIKPQSEVLRVLNGMGNGNGSFIETKLVSVAQAETQIGKTPFKKSKEIEALWAKKPGGPVLEPIAKGNEPFSGAIELEPVEIESGE